MAVADTMFMFYSMVFELAARNSFTSVPTFLVVSNIYEVMSLAT